MKLFFCFFLLLAFVALPGKNTGAELRHLKTKTELQQQEIERLTALLAEKERELKKLRIWMDNISADSRFTTVSDREQRLMHALKILADSSGNMALKTMELAELLRPRLNALPLASSDRVRLVMALEDLERSAARVTSIADTASASEDRLLKNVRVADKTAAQNDPDVRQAVADVAAKLGDSGRILVRESGTEPLVRVMVEAASKETCDEYVALVVDAIKRKGHAV